MDRSRSRAGGAAAALAAALALAALAPSGAAAQTACNYEGAAQVLQVTMSAPSDEAELATGLADKIVVRSAGGNVACGGGSATLANTDDITVADNSPGSTTLRILDPFHFAFYTDTIYAPGAGSEDRLVVVGTAAPFIDEYRFGSAGLDSDTDLATDVTYFGSAPEYVDAVMGSGNDTVRGSGNFGTGGPVPATTKLVLEGGDGSDNLEGGEGDDYVDGGAGDDHVSGGFGGADTLVPDDGGGGDDLVTGDAEDLVLYGEATHPIEADLGAGTVTGEGDDTLEGIGGVIGSLFDDRLAGGPGPDHLGGIGGDDLLEGGGGDDLLEGGAGTDTVAYAGAPSGVAVNLRTGLGQGQGEDAIGGVENVAGGAFADILTGDDEPNRLLGGAGSDYVEAGGGADLVEVRDGVDDAVACGDGADRVVSDRRSLDLVGSDCEAVDALPEAAGGAGGSGSGAGAGSASAPAPAASVCRVPKLRGFTVRADRARLRRAGCRLGRVRGHGGRGARVSGQGIAPGTVRPAGAKVGVRLGG